MEIKVISNEEFEKYLCASHPPKGLFMTFENGWYKALDNCSGYGKAQADFTNEQECRIWLEVHVD